MKFNQQDLTNLLDESRALALVITHGDSIAARAGGLSEQGFQSLRTALARHWKETSRQDMNRYVGLTLDNRFILVFAKPLPDEEHVLGLVFPLQVPLIRIRQDMTDIQRAIMEIKAEFPDPGLVLEQSLHTGPIIDPNPDRDGPNTHHISGWQPERNQEMNYAEDIALPQEKFPRQEKSQDGEHTSTKRYLTYGAPMKGDPRVPQHDVKSDQDDIPWQLIEESIPESVFDQQERRPEQVRYPWRPLGEKVYPNDDLVNVLQDDFEVKNDLAEPIGWTPPPVDVHGAQPTSEDMGDEDTSPIDILVSVEDWEEDISETTFYLVPRLETHYILGELSQQLKIWLPAICDRYGWQLSGLSIRPNYLKWALRDFPGSLIQKILRAVRRETSERIFRIFPDLETGNQSGDYWSPGYLVDTQNHDFSTQALISHFSKCRM